MRPTSSAPILPCPTPWQGTLCYPLQSCTGFKPGGVTSVWPCLHLFFFLFPSQLRPWGKRTRSLTCNTERNKWHKTDLHHEMRYDEGLPYLIWSGHFATLSRQNHKYPKDRVSSLALSCLGLSKLHAIILTNYFSLLIPVCLHKGDNKIWAEGAAKWDKIEAWTFFRLTRFVSFEEITHFFVSWLMKPRPQKSPDRKGVLGPSPAPFAITWDKQSTPAGATYTCQWGARADIPIGRYTHFHCPATA